MNGQTLAVTLGAMFGAGFCAGLLARSFWDWYFWRKHARLKAEWQKLHAPVTETEFLHLVKGGKGEPR
jgi:hypothetical protein